MKLLIGLSIIAAGILTTQNSYADYTTTSRQLAFSPNAHVGNVQICPHLAEKAGCTAMDTSEACGVKIISQNNPGYFSTRVTK